jgi:hypothetical protein
MRTLPITLATLFIAASACAVTVRASATGAAAEQAHGWSILEGSWEGSFEAVSPTPEGHSISSQVTIRLTFHNGSVRVFSGQGGAWEEVAPNRFKVEFIGTNALVYLVHAGQIPTPDGSRWFETYLIAVAARTEDSLLGHWARVVNHPDVAPDDPDRAFTVAGDLVFRRVRGPGEG